MTAKQVVALRKALGSFVESYSEEFGRSERRYWCRKYLEGLLVEGERKSIEPMAKRVEGDDQALQQFVNQSPWEHEAVLAKLRGQMLKKSENPEGVLVLDDTSLPAFGRCGSAILWSTRQNCQLSECGYLALGGAETALAFDWTALFA